MTASLLIAAPELGAGALPPEPLDPGEASGRTLEDDLRALIRGERRECLVCGEQVDRDHDGGLVCPACGSSLDPAPQIPGQLELL